MTENEQFELIELEELGLCIQDNDSGVLYYMNDRTSFASLCALLNAQEQRIEALESGFEKDLKAMDSDCMKCEKRYQELIKELEQEVETLQDQLAHGVSDLDGDVE